MNRFRKVTVEIDGHTFTAGLADWTVRPAGAGVMSGRVDLSLGVEDVREVLLALGGITTPPDPP